MNLPQHLIVTVGTSLLGNLSRESKIAAAVQNKQWQAVFDYLKQYQATDRICGAELNSSFQLLDQHKIAESTVFHLCISDTQQGQIVGELLKAYLSQSHDVQLYTIKGLQDQDPVRFGNEGLRNLVRLCGEIIQAAGDPRYVALNATGGYKAQIAIAALIGSALQVPVYYKHELFNNVIGFPPMPISMDDELIENHLGLLLAAQESTVELAPPKDEKLLPLLDIINEGEQMCYALSPLGQICLASYEQRHPIQTALPPAANERKDPRLRDDHYPKGFEEYVHKIWRETPYITQIVSKEYNRQRAIRDRHFYISQLEPEQIMGEYVDKNNFGARFQILISQDSSRQRQAVIRDLSLRYGK